MSHLPPDPWKVLGIEKSADKAEIRKVYRKLVLSCHPDKVQDPTLKALKQDEFQRVQQAYELLNDDAERAKYEEQVKLHEMRLRAQAQAQAGLASKNMPNISVHRTTPRTPTAQHFEIRVAEPRSKPSPSRYPSYAKVYAQYHNPSYDDGFHSPDDEPRRRTERESAFEKSYRREDDRTKESRRGGDKDDKRRDDEQAERRRRDKEKEQLAKERREKEEKRSREKRRETESKSRLKAGPYVETQPMDDHVYPKTDKKKVASSSTKQYDDTRERSSTRRERAESPRVEVVGDKSDKTDLLKEAAASYIEKHRAKAKAVPPGLPPRAATFHEPLSYRTPPGVPPPPVDEYLEENVRRSSARVAHRRPSDPVHELPRRSKEKLAYAPDAHIASPSSPKDRAPPLSRSSTMPPGVEPDAPLRYRDSSARRPPPLGKSQTWAPGGGDVRPPAFEEFDDSAHRSRSRREPVEEVRREPIRRQTSYKVGPDRRTTSSRTADVYDDVYVLEEYDDARHMSGRRHRHDAYAPQYVETRDNSYYYDTPTQLPYKVKTSKPIAPDDIQYSQYSYPQTQRPIYAQQ
ncbi:hypothetical protein DL546_002454 [Coniochaeta pulveracea]|uniref:J domain-containing protein n=1 Tax=Coniochaeta pulveracea TaxID=177199 RepID=A0A420Y230_9PEZI|nr:hypothetical protein DL546_002454 [Coniochaeta pulveracea]